MSETSTSTSTPTLASIVQTPPLPTITTTPTPTPTPTLTSTQPDPNSQFTEAKDVSILANQSQMTLTQELAKKSALKSQLISIAVTKSFDSHTFTHTHLNCILDSPLF